MYFVFIAISLLAPLAAFLTPLEPQNACEKDCNTYYQAGVVAVILARGGSKGIPSKNLAKIDGASLLGRALRTISHCDCFAEVWVSTDDEQIATEARRYNASVHYRSAHSARDEATSLESIQEFLNANRHMKNVALIQCTSVFLRKEYLAAAVERFSKYTDIDCIFSVYRSWKLRWKHEANATYLKAINFDPSHRPRRQDWQGELIETGMFYFFRRHLAETLGLLQTDRCEYVEIAERHALEIDNSMQLTMANILATIPGW